jgi:Na+/H+-dicarboxylate symporter
VGLGSQVLIGMVAGTLLGAALGQRVTVLQPVGDLFIRLLVLAAVPLVFFNLLAGLTTLTDLKTLGRLTAKIVTYYGVTTVVAVAIGIGAMELFRPGVGVTQRAQLTQEVAAAPSVVQVLLDLIPGNVVRAFSEGNVAQVVVLADGPRDRLRTVFADIATLFRKVVDFILKVAPYGVGALMAVTVGRYGPQVFGPMARFVGGITAAQLVIFLLYLTLLKALTPYRPLRFLKQTGTVWATTAATTSSLASLSTALEAADTMRIPRSIYAFTLPLGNQINKDGTAALLGAIVVFTAQASGTSLSGGDLVTIVLLGLLLSAGSGGIPAGGFVVALVMVEAFHLPLEMAAMVGGIYRLIDMGNTTLNVMGDMIGTLLVTHWERDRLPSELTV